MKSKIELTEQEQGIIEAALNDYWHAAHESLENNSVMMSDGTKRPLGDIEKSMLEKKERINDADIKAFRKFMKYPQEIKPLIDQIPKEHKKALKIIIEYYYALGCQDVKSLLEEIIDIPNKEIKSYVVSHEDNLEGG